MAPMENRQCLITVQKVESEAYRAKSQPLVACSQSYAPMLHILYYVLRAGESNRDLPSCSRFPERTSAYWPIKPCAAVRHDGGRTE